MSGRYDSTLSSGSTGRREMIRTLSRAPSNSTFTMSSHSSRENDRLHMPKRSQRSSRFDKPQNPRVVSDASSVPAGLAMLREQAERDETYNTHQNDTQQSTFNIPPVPGFTELINGTYGDGTPVFSSRTKPTRFSSSRFQRNTSQQSNRYDVGAVKIPEQEQGMVLSLKHVQERVSQLERTNTRQEAYITELEDKNAALERANSSLRHRARSDSAMGLSDDDSDNTQGSGMGYRTLAVQKNRLEHNVRLLSQQIEEINKKVSITEGALKAVSDERNQAVTQLGVAFVSLENVKCEKEKVENLRIESEERVEKFCLENERLRAEVTEVSKRLDRLKERYRSKAQVTNTVGHHLNEYLFGNKAIDAPSSRPSGEKKSDKPANGQGSESQAKAGISSSYKSGVSKKPSLDEFMEEFPTVEELRNYDEDTGIIDLPKRALFPRTYQLQAVKQQEAREREARKREAREQEHTRSTNITMPDTSAVANLRAGLEEKHASHARSTKQRPRASSWDCIMQECEKRKAERRALREAQRQSSLPQVGSAKAVAPANQTQTQHVTKASITTRHQRSHSDPTSERPKMDDDHLPEEDFSEIDNAELTHFSQSTRSTDCQQPKPILKDPLAKLVPVSCRKRVSFDGDEPTMRPSQPPTAALHNVVTTLEKELAGVKEQLDAHTKAYDKLDKSQCGRHHILLNNKIIELRGVMEFKRKQIYDAYDVLEGQRKAGRIGALGQLYHYHQPRYDRPPQIS